MHIARLAPHPHDPRAALLHLQPDDGRRVHDLSNAGTYDAERRAWLYHASELDTLRTLLAQLMIYLVDETRPATAQPPRPNELCDHMRDPAHCPYCPGRRLAYLEPIE